MCVTNLCILTGSRAGSNIITNRARALTARRADRRVDARLTTKSISQHPADIRNESSVPELSLDHAARALCYTWRSGPFFGPKSLSNLTQIHAVFNFNTKRN